MLDEFMLVNLKFVKFFLILFGGLKFYAYLCIRNKRISSKEYLNQLKQNEKRKRKNDN